MINQPNSFMLKICAFTIMCIYNPAFAQTTRSGDSVIQPSSSNNINNNISSSGTVTRNSYNPQGNVEYTNTACPSGFTGASGGNTFKTQQRLISNFSATGTTTKTSFGPWEPVTNDYCSKTESRSIGCPSGQTGSATEARTVTYNTSGTSNGSWYQTSNSCVTPPPPPPACTPYSVGSSQSCSSVYGSGYSGTVYYTTNYTCNSSGNLVAGGRQYSYDTCSYYSPPPVYNPPPPPPPSVICSPSNWPNTYSCPSGQNGNITSTSYNICPNGAYSPGTQYEGTRTNNCTPAYVPPPPPPVICSPSNWPNTYSCPAGQTGNITSTSYNICPNGAYSPGTQYEGTRTNNCRNNTPPPPPPPPAGCWLELDGYYAGVGTVASACRVQGAGTTYPRGQSYRCTAGGWANQSPGNSMYYDYCQ
jgi:hypothetical protein